MCIVFVLLGQASSFCHSVVSTVSGFKQGAKVLFPFTYFVMVMLWQEPDFFFFLKMYLVVFYDLVWLKMVTIFIIFSI